MSVIEVENNMQALDPTKQQYGIDRITQGHLTGIKVIRRMQPLEAAGQQFNLDKIGQEQPTEPILVLKQQHSIDQVMQEKPTEPITESLPAPVFDAIKRRRSVGQLTQQEPTRVQIEHILEAATYAPSHHVTEPWRFLVLTGSAREELGNIMAASLSLRLEDRFSEKARKQLLKERTKPLRAPVIITVAMIGLKDMKGSLLIENMEAAGAAVQNMLLAAQEIGLATLWRTGDSAYDPLVKRWLGMSPEDHIVGFIYVGFPKVSRAQRVPTRFSERTTWIS